MFIFKNRILLSVFFVAIALRSSPLSAFTSVQTSTSIGAYRDYDQNNRYPLYHSWSLNGIYSSGFETSIHFLLDNDFSTNKWHFLPTEALIEVPFAGPLYSAASNQSKIKLGRQLFVEGFDLAILDGVQIPVLWSKSGGFKIYAGSLRSPDFDQVTEAMTSFAGFSIWQDILNYSLRAGFSGREDGLVNHRAFGAIARQWERAPLAPQILLKEEWNPDDNSFSQSVSELALQLSSSTSLRFGHSYLHPQPIQKLAQASFVYGLLAISPTESAQMDFAWDASEDLQTSIGARTFRYNSGFSFENGRQQELSLNWQFQPGRWLGSSFCVIDSYGGHVSDAGLRYVASVSSESQFRLEYDLAYLKKIDAISAWVQHARSGFETRIASRAKAEFLLEAERNMYYQFDLRTMLYVTNYL